MRAKAVLMALAMMTTALAGCTGTDGVTEVDEDALNELIQNNLQDFINNTTVVVNQDFHYHNNTTYVVDDGDYSNTIVNEYNNTTNVEGSDVHNYNTENDYSAMNYSFVGGTGDSGAMLYMLDMEFTLVDLLPEYGNIDHRNNTIDYEWTYYDYLTNADRTDVFTIQCSDYYLIGSQGEDSYSYWESSNTQEYNNYANAWNNLYNQTISDMLAHAANDYYDDSVRAACDENYTPYLGYVHLIDLPIPAGVALKDVFDLSMAFNPESQVWCADRPASGSYEGSYTYQNVCTFDWGNDGDVDYWYQNSFRIYGETEWGYYDFTAMPPWFGGEGNVTLPIYVSGIESGIQYRVILYFEMGSVVNYEE